MAFYVDQSVYVTEALNGLLMEGGLGALILTGVVLPIFTGSAQLLDCGAQHSLCVVGCSCRTLAVWADDQHHDAQWSFTPGGRYTGADGRQSLLKISIVICKEQTFAEAHS